MGKFPCNNSNTEGVFNYISCGFIFFGYTFMQIFLCAVQIVFSTFFTASEQCLDSIPFSLLDVQDLNI